ncbi:MAG: hypothetical protein P8R54_06910 [Myxococcota bacterium]|nr:hypothetical protein [Myxococcota bacterium]
MRLLLLFLLLGCAPKGAGNVVSDNDTSAEAPTTIDTGTSSAETGLTEDIAWWQLSGQLQVVTGLLVPEQTILQISLLTEALEPVCTESFSLSAQLEATLPHPDIYAWWLVSLGDGDGGCAGKSTPDTPFYLGIGAMYADILPGLLDVPDIVAPEALNGAYASFDEGETLLVFGASGLAETWSAGGAPVEKPPIPDGIWRIEPVYTFEIMK